MVRRIFTMMLAATVFGVVIFSAMRFAEQNATHQITLKSIGDAGLGLFNIILAAIEILGFIFILVVFHGYLRSRRPHRFAFEGVRNEAKLSSEQNSPTDLNTLAREELMHQFLVIYYELQSFIYEEERQRCIESGHAQKESDGRPNPVRSFFSDELNFADVPDTQNLALFFPSLHRKIYDPHDLTMTMIYFLKQNLEQVMGGIQVPYQNANGKRTSDKALLSRHGQISMVALQEIVSSVPEAMRPVISLIDAIIPSRYTKASVYLQRQGDPSAPCGRAGITLEVASPDTSAGPMVRTLWQSVQNKDGEVSDKKLPGPTEGQLAGQYVELLKPAMRLLVLLFWEQKLITSLSNGKGAKGDSMSQQEYIACFFFLLGALYAVSGMQFRPQRAFFARLAIEYFHLAANLHPDWEIPHSYIGYVYGSLLARYEGNANRRAGFIRSGIEAYDTYYALAGKRVGKKRTQADACLKKALLLLYSDQDKDFDESVNQLSQSLQIIDDPLTYEYEPQQYDTYLYNVACWYGRVMNKDARSRKHIEQKLRECENVEFYPIQQEARRYLVYSMARSLFVWFLVEEDRDLCCVIDKQAAEKLKEELSRIHEEEIKLSRNYKLSYQKGAEFQERVDEIMRTVWPR